MKRSSWNAPFAALAMGAAVSALALGLTAALIAGCSHTDSSGESTPPPPPDQVYTTRGKIETLPDAAKPGSELTILHEPIPAFVNMQGKVQPMDSMVMPFEPARGLSLAGLSVGDVVEFTFEVRWKHRPYIQVTRIDKLPAGTELHIGKAGGQ